MYQARYPDTEIRNVTRWTCIGGGYENNHRGLRGEVLSPGLNAAIRAVARAGNDKGARFLGIRNGWQGLMENDTLPLSPDTVSGMIERGGTMLGTSRTDPVHQPDHISIKPGIRLKKMR